MTTNKTQQKLIVTYSVNDAFIIPHGINLRDTTQVEKTFVKWNHLTIYLTDGTTIEVDSENEIHFAEYKYPDAEKIIDEECDEDDESESEDEPEVTPASAPELTPASAPEDALCDRCKIHECGAWTRTEDERTYNFCEDCMIFWDEGAGHNLEDGTPLTIAEYTDRVMRQITDETHGDPIPEQDADGHDIKCYYCNGRGCDAWMWGLWEQVKQPIHRDCYYDDEIITENKNKQ